MLGERGSHPLTKTSVVSYSLVKKDKLVNHC